MIENRPSLILCLHGHIVPVLHTCLRSVLRRHMDMPLGDDTALVQVNGTLRADDRNRRAAGRISGFPERSLHAQLHGVRGGNLHLGGLSHRSEHAHIFNCPQLQPYDGHLFVGRELAAHQLFFLRELVARPEQCFHMLLCQMHMSGGHTHGNHVAIRAFLLRHGLHNHFSNQFNLTRFHCIPFRIFEKRAGASPGKRFCPFSGHYRQVLPSEPFRL